MALTNLPSLPHINVVGSVVTGTHGGGINNQAMATYVTQMRFVDPNGELKVVNNDTPDFKRYLHSFGLLGVIYEMTMTIEPEFAVIKCIYEDVPWDFLQDPQQYETLMYAHDYLSFFTDWKKPMMTSAWLAQRVSVEFYEENKDKNLCKDFQGAKLVDRIHPVPNYDSDACVSTGVGMWNNKLYHFLPDKPPSAGGEELQAEFFVKFEDLPEAVGLIHALQPLLEDVLMISELRPVKADDIPLSPAHGRNVVGIHFTMHKELDMVNFPIIVLQNSLQKFNYRMHYGKLFFDMPDVFAGREDDLEKLKDLASQYTPNKFSNCYTESLIFQKEECKFANNDPVYS